MMKEILYKLFGAGLLSNVLGALVRHGLTALGGLLLGLGIEEAVVTDFISSSTQIGIALIALLVSYSMSVMQKVDKAKEVTKLENKIEHKAETRKR